MMADNTRKIRASLIWRYSRPILAQMQMRSISQEQAQESLASLLARNGGQFGRFYKSPFGFSFFLGGTKYRVRLGALRFSYKPERPKVCRSLPVG